MRMPTLSGAQAVIGLMASFFSLVGGVYTGVQYFSRAPGTGELVTVVHDARTDRPIAGPHVEVLSVKDALVTTLTPGAQGQGRTRLLAGAYRVRVTHPRYTADTRRVQIGAGQTAEIRIRLTPRGSGSAPSAVVAETTRTVHEGIRGVRRFFEGLAR